MCRKAVHSKLKEPDHREVVSGFIRLHILHRAAQEPLAGFWMVEELRIGGLAIGVIRRPNFASSFIVAKLNSPKTRWTFEDQRTCFDNYRRQSLPRSYWQLTDDAL
jgi:hypothetical protein